MATKELFKKLIVDFQERKIENVFERDIDIYPPANENVNKIVSLIGVRRSGKTFILYSLISRLRKTIDIGNITYINFEDDRLFPITLSDLNMFIEAYYELYPDKKDETVFFFFDEIQNIEHWEKFIRRLYDSEKCRIFITGSSSTLLSGEIASSLRGRTITYEIFPLSFNEFLSAKSIKININSSRSVSVIKNAFSEYVLKGGFPEIINANEELSNRIVEDYVDLIIYKDILERYRLLNTFFLKFLIKYCFSNISSLFSINKIYNDFKSQGLAISKNTIYEYIEYMENAFTVFTVPVYGTLKDRIRNPRKIYGVDIGIKKIMDGSFSPDLGKIYENIVYLKLRKISKDIYYFKGKREVDFYCRLNGKHTLINVSYDISGSAAQKREIEGLSEAMDFFNAGESFLITGEVEKKIDLDRKKIHIIPLWKWLIT